MPGPLTMRRSRHDESVTVSSTVANPGPSPGTRADAACALGRPPDADLAQSGGLATIAGVQAESSLSTLSISRRSVLQAGAGLLAGLLVGCGDDESGGGSATLGSEEAPLQRFTLVAEDLRWNVERVVVPAGSELVATVDNQDDGIGHNLHVTLGDEDPQTPVESGPVRQTLRFTILQPGTYRFVCDPHAATMEGEIVAV